MNGEYIEAREVSLEDWLNLLKNNPKDKCFVDYEFPTEEHPLHYIDSISSRTENEINFLLRKLLIKNGSLGIDKQGIHSIKYKL